MTTLDELRWSARASHEWLESIVNDVTPDQASWQPPGRANTIASTYAHIVRNFDEDMNQRFLCRPLLSDGPWLGRTGLPPGPCEWEPGVKIDWRALREYGRAMGEFVIVTVDALAEPDLERTVDLSTPDRAVWLGIDIVRLTVGRHVAMHGGEIACLKGLQGAKGYLGGLDTNQP